MPLALPGTERDVTFLIADLAGFTALTETHGSRHAAWVVTRFVEIVHAVLPPGVRLVERAGDAVLLVAPDAASAVRAAVALHDATEREPLFPLLRSGLHGGRVVELEGHYFGTALNLTARLAAYAAPGQILCTASLAAAAGPVAGVRFRDLGPVALKNIRRPVPIAEVVVGDRPPADERVDPVCQMRVDPATAPAHRVRGGRTYHFCSAACASTFALEPERAEGTR